jgi:hypothetical protein
MVISLNCLRLPEWPRDLVEYSTFRGPGKIEGSIVNWLNSSDERLLAADEALLSAGAAA